jgi:tRNA modification GTPase
MLKFDTESTICAIASGSEGALRGIIRITGPDAVAVCLRAFSGFDMPTRPTRLSVQASIPMLGETSASLFLWPDGRSYTGQPSAEIHMLGAPILLQGMVQLLVQSGAVLAQPGEFTLRAFLAGRLDLTQCEAVLGVIHAHSEKELDVALRQLAGGLAGPLKNIRRNLIELLADIEAGLDFVDEDIQFIDQNQIESRITEAKGIVTELLAQMNSRSAQDRELQLAIVGLPNAGKSSLLNAIANHQLAIVSAIAGTTRDYIRYRMTHKGVTFDLLDTAGIEAVSGDSPRDIAQAFTQEQIEQADLILACTPIDAMNSTDSLLEKLIESVPNIPIWKIITKGDLSEYQDVITEFAIRNPNPIVVSVLDGSGVAELRNALIHWVIDQQTSTQDAVPMTVERCATALRNALLALEEAMNASRSRYGDEIIAGEIRIAIDEIGLVAGTVYTDDVLDALFSRFCIGK